MYQTFTPTGPTVLVDTTPRQVSPSNGAAVNAGTYRIRNLATADAWIAWLAPKGDGTAPTMGTTTAPVAGTPQANTLGMPSGGVETFYLGPNMYFKASAGATFEVTPGDGL